MQNLQKLILRYRREHKFLPVGLCFAEVAHRVLQAFVMVYFCAIHLVIELFEDYVEFLVVDARYVHSGAF